MSSKLMLKMLADLAGVTPEEIMATIEQFQTMTIDGVKTLERIDARLSAIEQHLGIEQTILPPSQIEPVEYEFASEGQTDGQENRS